MKQVLLSNVKDGKTFKISNRKSGATYKRVKKVRGKNGTMIVFTSLSSERSFERKGSMKVWING